MLLGEPVPAAVVGDKSGDLPRGRDLTGWAAAFRWLFEEMGGWSPDLRKGDVRDRIVQYAAELEAPSEAQQWRDLSATSRYEVLSVLGDPTRCSSVQMKAADVLASYCPDKELAEFRAWQARQGKP